MLKSDRARSLWKIHFCLSLGIKDPTLVVWKFCHLFFFVIWLSIVNPVSGKILALELLPKMFFANQTNQTARFFKVIYFKKSRDQVNFLHVDTTSYCYCFWWGWPGMPKIPKITSLQYHCNISRALSSLRHFLATESPWTLFRMGIFGTAHGMGGGAKGPLPKICRPYPTMIKIGAVIPYLKKIQKIYESCDTPSEFCWHQHFFLRKSGNFIISNNTDIDSILMHNF